MIIMTLKQKIELYYAEPILNQLGIRDSVESADSPDLRYSENGRIVGIEVVSCYPDGDKPGTFSMMESRTYEACREYSKKLKREGNKGVLVCVSLTDAAYEPDNTVSTNQFKRIVIKDCPTHGVLKLWTVFCSVALCILYLNIATLWQMYLVK